MLTEDSQNSNRKETEFKSNAKDVKSQTNSHAHSNTNSLAITGVPTHDGTKLNQMDATNEMLNFTMTKKK
jgi:hypothetical protein